MSNVRGVRLGNNWYQYQPVANNVQEVLEQDFALMPIAILTG